MIVPSVLDGFDLTVLRVREWLRCAHPKKVVVQSRLVGCLVGILVWRMVRWTGERAFTLTGTAVVGQPTSQLEIAVLTTFITSVVHLILRVLSATAEVTKHILHVWCQPLWCRKIIRCAMLVSTRSLLLSPHTYLLSLPLW